MTLEEIDSRLPNGFHDSTLSKIVHDYESAKLRLAVDVLIDMTGGVAGNEPRYRSGELSFQGVLFCLIEAPDPQSSFRHPGSIWFRFDKTEPGILSDALIRSAPPTTMYYSFFVLDWLSSIHVAAARVEFIWSDTGEQISPE